MNKKNEKLYNKPNSKSFEELEAAVQSVRKNEKWRVEYMTLEMRYKEL